MQDHPELALSGYRVALAVLPGAFAFGTQLGLWDRLFGLHLAGYPDRAEVALLAVSALVCLAGLARERRFPAWTFPALGVALCSIAMGAVASPLLLPIWLGTVAVAVVAWCRRATPLMPWEAWLALLLVLGAALRIPAVLLPIDECCPPAGLELYRRVSALTLLPLAFLGAVPAAVGGLYARRHGLVAGLVYAGSMYVVWGSLGSAGHGWLAGPYHGLLAGWITIHAPVLFLMVTPIAVAGLRTTGARAAGLLAPPALAVAAAAQLAFQPHLSPFEALVDLPAFLLPMAVALAVYARLSPRPGGAPQPGA